MQKYDPVKEEKEILKFWEDNDIRNKANEKNKNGKPFYFLDGPPYTSGKIHLGTAWNKSLKDMVTRYKRMKGFDVWDRAGYDMHGLPTEGKVQAKLELKTKDDILKYGLARFVKDCRDFAVGNLLIMNKDFKNLGVWLDFDNAYQTIANEYIEGTWWLVKKAHEKKRLYEGQMTMTWCGSCQTSLAKHELEYKNVVDKSLYVKFKVKGKEDDYLVIWTTTPWTIPFNLGVMANPTMDYVKVKAGKENWILAKDLLDNVMKKANVESYKVIEELKGRSLEGLQYEHPMQDMLKDHYANLSKKAKKLHVVAMSEEYVTAESGTGLVHMAPGCGAEDYEVGHREGIPPFNEVKEDGYYDSTMGELSGYHVKADTQKFIEAIEKSGSLIAKEDYPHDYGHCWRCRNPILYRTTTQWFFKVEDLIEKLRKTNKEKINWVPDWAGSNQFDSWLENLRDNGITRQRYWGSPLPVWKCEKCKEYVVVESRKELKALNANKIPDDLHKPWIDEVTLPCKCGGIMKRNPDIMDVWIDAGVDSWASLHYPHDDKLFKKYFPADFITEGKDQIRGWFNLLFVASMLGMDDISFKNCYMTGFINDSQGRKMSKSIGNVISPNEVTEKYGADTFRYYSIGASAPGLDLNYNFDDVEIKRRNLNILWNLHNFVLDLSHALGKNPAELKEVLLGEEERYILSKLNSKIKKVTVLLDSYKLNEVPWEAEELYIELSRTYIQLVREKTNSGSDEEKEAVLYASYNSMMEIMKIMAPITPMITEMMYQNFKKEFNLSKESIHLYDYPACDESRIDNKLEHDVDCVKDVITAALGAREKAQIGIRWPLQNLIVETDDSEVKKAVEDLSSLIEAQVNVKGVRLERFLNIKTTYKPNFKELGKDFGKETHKIAAKIEKGEIKDLETRHYSVEREMPDRWFIGEFSKGSVYLTSDVQKELVSEGYYREVLRRVQSFRKDAGLKKTDVIKLHLKMPKELLEHVKLFRDQLKDRVGASELELSTDAPKLKSERNMKDSVKGMDLEAFF